MTHFNTYLTKDPLEVLVQRIQEFYAKSHPLSDGDSEVGILKLNLTEEDVADWIAAYAEKSEETGEYLVRLIRGRYRQMIRFDSIKVRWIPEVGDWIALFLLEGNLTFTMVGNNVT